MTVQITLTIPDELYIRAKNLAQTSVRDVAQVLADSIVLMDREIKDIDLSEPDEALEKERASYLSLHSLLWKKYPGQYVAIYHGKLVDHDTDPDALWERVDARFPDEFVWVAEVQEQPIQTISIPSFQLIPERV